MAKTTVHLDDAMVERLRRYVPPRGLNRFINQALAEKIDALERAQVEAAMREGYVSTRADREELATDWDVLDVEGWPA